MAVLTEEQTMLRDSAKEWVASRSPVAALRALRDGGSGAGYDPAIWREMGEMGWVGVVAPEAHGGSEFGHLGLGLILEEAGRTLTASPLLSTALIGVDALTLGGSAEQQAAWLPRIAGGEAVVALALEERAQHDPARIACLAGRAGEGWAVTGAKTFVLDGMDTDLLLVAARHAGAPGEAEGVALFLVDPEAPGVTRSRLNTVDSRGAAAIRFEGAPAQPLGAVENGAVVLEQVLDRARAGAAAEMLGVALQAFETTLDYLKTRTQFGALIGSFQALQHRAAKMYTQLELTRSCVEEALDAIDRGANDVRAQCSLAKAMAGDTLHTVSNEMVQMHGGIGMTDAADPGLYLKRARVLEAAYGGASYHRDRYAKLLGF